MITIIMVWIAIMKGIEVPLIFGVVSLVVEILSWAFVLSMVNN